MNCADGMKDFTTAIEMARAYDIDPKRFRRALRRADPKWHPHNARWDVKIDSAEYRKMEQNSLYPCGDSECERGCQIGSLQTHIVRTRLQ